MHEPLVGSDPSFKVKAVIAEVQSQFRYMISYQKAWMTKQKAIEKVMVVRKHPMKLYCNGVQQCVMLSEGQLFS